MMNRILKSQQEITLMVTARKEQFDTLAQVLADKGMQAAWAATGADALTAVESRPVGLLVIDDVMPDMTARKLVDRIVKVDPTIHAAVSSTLDPRTFHDRYEGLGVLMQLPAEPDRSASEKLIKQLQRVLQPGAEKI